MNIVFLYTPTAHHQRKHRVRLACTWRYYCFTVVGSITLEKKKMKKIPLLWSCIFAFVVARPLMSPALFVVFVFALFVASQKASHEGHPSLWPWYLQQRRRGLRRRTYGKVRHFFVFCFSPVIFHELSIFLPLPSPFVGKRMLSMGESNRNFSCVPNAQYLQ